MMLEAPLRQYDKEGEFPSCLIVYLPLFPTNNVLVNVNDSSPLLLSSSITISTRKIACVLYVRNVFVSMGKPTVLNLHILNTSTLI